MRSRKVVDVPEFGDVRVGRVPGIDGHDGSSKNFLGERPVRGRVVSKMRHSGHWWFSLQEEDGTVHADIRGDRLSKVRDEDLTRV